MREELDNWLKIETNLVVILDEIIGIHLVVSQLSYRMIDEGPESPTNDRILKSI